MPYISEVTHSGVSSEVNYSIDEVRTFTIQSPLKVNWFLPFSTLARWGGEFSTSSQETQCNSTRRFTDLTSSDPLKILLHQLGGGRAGVLTKIPQSLHSTRILLSNFIPFHEELVCF